MRNLQQQLWKSQTPAVPTTSPYPHCLHISLGTHVKPSASFSSRVRRREVECGAWQAVPEHCLVKLPLGKFTAEERGRKTTVADAVNGVPPALVTRTMISCVLPLVKMPAGSVQMPGTEVSPWRESEKHGSGKSSRLRGNLRIGEPAAEQA